jgi:hypothetical protein
VTTLRSLTKSGKPHDAVGDMSRFAISNEIRYDVSCYIRRVALDCMLDMGEVGDASRARFPIRV